MNEERAMASMEEFARSLESSFVAMSESFAAMGKAFSALADRIEPHRVVRREALAEGIHPAVHEGAL